MPIMPRRSNNTIIATIATAVVILLITLVITSGHNENAYVGYSLSAAETYANGELKIDVMMMNSGSIGVVPKITVIPINATIEKVEIPNSGEQLDDYSDFNSTVAIFKNLNLPSTWQNLGRWGSVYVIPKEGVASFKIICSVNVPFDLFHPRNEVHGVLPFELSYVYNDFGIFERLGA